MVAAKSIALGTWNFWIRCNQIEIKSTKSMLIVYLMDSKSSWIYVQLTLKDSSFLIRIVKKIETFLYILFAFLIGPSPPRLWAWSGIWGHDSHVRFWTS